MTHACLARNSSSPHQATVYQPTSQQPFEPDHLSHSQALPEYVPCCPWRKRGAGTATLSRPWAAAFVSQRTLLLPRCEATCSALHNFEFAGLRLTLPNLPGQPDARSRLRTSEHSKTPHCPSTCSPSAGRKTVRPSRTCR